MLYANISNVENNEKEIRELKVVSLIFLVSKNKNILFIQKSLNTRLGFKMSMLIMDCPNGYVYRLRSTKTLMFTGKEESLGHEFSKVYQLLWKAKVKYLLYNVLFIEYDN